MDIKLKSGVRSGSVRVPASKSQAHRLIICAALSKHTSRIYIDAFSDDILATINCLNAMGADIRVNGEICEISPIAKTSAERAILPCGESGSTLRFLLPVVGALGLNAAFDMKGRLPQRPLSPFKEQLISHGMSIAQNENLLYCEGRLRHGEYELPGDISSQYISGLLFALPLLEGESRLLITSHIESRDYISMTEQAIASAGISFEKTESGYTIPAPQTYSAPNETRVEADWSNAAFFLCMGAMSNEGIAINGLNPLSVQGDKRVLDIVRNTGASVTETDTGIIVKRDKLIAQRLDASEIPDLVPTLAALFSVCEGQSAIYNAARLRLKESDRLKTTREMLATLGADIKETEDGLIINGKPKLAGGKIFSHNDHRIAMAAAVASCACANEVEIVDAQCVNKSYPEFWNHFEALNCDTSVNGGKI